MEKFKKFNQDDYCDYCDRGVPLVTPKDTNDRGISMAYHGKGYRILYAYGYDVHGTGSNGIGCRIYFCPICGRSFENEQ